MSEKEGSAIERATRAWNLDDRAEVLKRNAMSLINERLAGKYKSISNEQIESEAKNLDGIGVPTLLTYFEATHIDTTRNDEKKLATLLGAATKLLTLGVIGN